MLKVGVLASGSGTNLQAIIDACESGRMDAGVVAVVSDDKDAFALERARKHGIDAIFSDATDREKHEDEIDGMFTERGVELVVGAGYMRILSPKFVRKWYGKLINIHPALLPAFPGLESWKQALDYGVKVTGCTVHFVNEGIDAGPIIIQRTTPVFNDDTPESLHARIQVEEHIAYPEALRLIAEGKAPV